METLTKDALYVGKRHSEGGIPAVIVEGDKKIEIEKDEYKVCSAAYSSPEILEFKQKTNKQILDYIHQEFSCKFDKHIAHVNEFILCRLVVLDETKHDRRGTVKQILDEMQSEKSCRISTGELGDGNSKKKDGGSLNEIPKRYKDMGFTKVGEKKESTRPEKKWMVLAKKGEQYKVIHGGYKGMQDYSQHHDKERRERFWQRMGGANSAKANDPFSPLYWHKKFGTWEEGGAVTIDKPKDSANKKKNPAKGKAKFVPVVFTPEQIEARWAKKKEHMMELAEKMRSLRYHVLKELKSFDEQKNNDKKFEKQFLIALAIGIAMATAERIGNRASAAEGRVGVTGLRKKHVIIKGNHVALRYVGKSHVKHYKIIQDEAVASAIKKAMKIKGRELFQCSDGSRVTQEDVNNYLAEFGNITFKDIRSFSANRWMIEKLSKRKIPEKEKDRKKLFAEIAKEVAAKVGHTKNSLLKHYAVPELSTSYIEKGEIINLKDMGYFKEGGEIKANKPDEKTLEHIAAKVIQKYPEINNGGCAQFAIAIHDLFGFDKFYLFYEDGDKKEPTHVSLNIDGKIYDPEGFDDASKFKHVIKEATLDQVKEYRKSLGDKYDQNELVNFIKDIVEKKSIKPKDLPEDMQVLLFQLFEEADKDVPVELPTKQLLLSDLPFFELDKERGIEHAAEFIGQDIPPIIIADNRLIDGAHRIWGKKVEGVDSITAIDLTGIYQPSERYPELVAKKEKLSVGGLIAPNGNNSNLTKEQYKLVRTPEFKAWFGDWEMSPEEASEVVDENGEPLVVYHGTNSKFREFDYNRPTIGFHFGSKSHSERRLLDTNLRDLKKGKAINDNIIIPVFLNLRRVEPIDKDIKNWDDWDGINLIWRQLELTGSPQKYAVKRTGKPDYNKIRDVLKESIDGIKYTNYFEGKGVSWIVLDANNIKLADGTNTTFDSNSPDIRFDEGGKISTLFKENETEFSNINDILNDENGYQFWYKRRKSRIEHMPPEEYLRRVRAGNDYKQGDWFSTEKLESVKKAFASGIKLPMPFLEWRDGVFHQEGRHRATAAKELGEELIPVAIIEDVTQADLDQRTVELVEAAMSVVGKDKEAIKDYLRNGMHYDGVMYITQSDYFKEATKEEMAKGGQIFNFFDKQYDIDKAYKLINSGTIMFDIKTIPTFEVRHRAFNKEYSDSLNPDFDVAQGLMINYEGKDLLIDGYHRMNKAYSSGKKEIRVYYIDNPKTISKFSRKYEKGGEIDCGCKHEQGGAIGDIFDADSFFRKYKVSYEDVNNKRIELASSYNDPLSDALDFYKINRNVNSHKFSDVYTDFYKVFLSEPLPTKVPNKAQQFDAFDLPHDENIYVFPAKVRKVEPLKNQTLIDKIKSLKDIVGNNELRPQLMGVYLDKDKGNVVATDSKKMIIVKDGTINSSGTFDVKTGKQIPESELGVSPYPDYSRIIPEEQLIKVSAKVSDLLSKVEGIAKANKFFNVRNSEDGDSIRALIQVGDNQFFFNADYFAEILTVLAKYGVDDIVIELSNERSDKPLIIRAGDVYALVMPVFTPNHYSTVLVSDEQVVSDNDSIDDALAQRIKADDLHNHLTKENTVLYGKRDKLRSERIKNGKLVDAKTLNKLDSEIDGIQKKIDDNEVMLAQRRAEILESLRPDSAPASPSDWKLVPMTGGREKYVRYIGTLHQEIIKKADGTAYVTTTDKNDMMGVDQYSQTVSADISDDLPALLSAQAYADLFVEKKILAPLSLKFKELTNILESESIADKYTFTDDTLQSNEVMFVKWLLTEPYKGKFANKTTVDNDGAKMFGIVTSSGTPDQHKIKNLLEFSIVLQARGITASDESNRDKFDKLVYLYENQQNISWRDSESILWQQYSTPMPISFLAGIYALNKKDND